MTMNRHEFLKAMAAIGLTTAAQAGYLTTAFAQTDSPCDLVAVMGGDPAEMFAKAMETMGGMKRFIKPGAKVTVKPNIGWDKTPELAANTNPLLVAAIIESCFAAGASQVQVFDCTCDNWQKTYASSGIAEAAKKAGATVVPGNDENYYLPVSLPKGKKLTETKIHRAIVECDAWINVPVLKNHGGARMTIAMKNLMGIVFDRQYFHKNDLQQCIADICTYNKPPVLNIVDAFRVMKSNGPRGKSENDVVMPRGLFASTDIVAIDTAAVHFFNQIEKMTLEEVGHIGKGEEHQLGTTDLSKLTVKRVRMS